MDTYINILKDMIFLKSLSSFFFSFFFFFGVLIAVLSTEIFLGKNASSLD